MARIGNEDHATAEAVLAGPSLRRPTFDSTAAHEEIVVDKMALEHVILLLLRLSPVSTTLIPSFITDAVYP
jgi:hypothetical protein